MKKTVFFIPAILAAVFYGGIAILISPSVISPIVYIWIVLLVASGALLSRKIFLGGLPGVLPGIHLMYMSTKDTGQAINGELPTGIAVALFYLLCSVYVFYSDRKNSPKPEEQ